MKKKVVKKKSSSLKKAPPKKKTAKKKSAVLKKVSPKKKTAKKKSAVLKKVSPKKKTIKKKSAVPKKVSPKKKTTKKKSATPKKVSPKKKTTKKKSAAPKKRTPRKKLVKKKTSVRKKHTPPKKAKARKIASIRSGAAKAKPLGLRRNKKYMNLDQLDYFRNLLLSRRNELISEADRTVDYMQTDSNTYADTIDQASQEEEFTLQLKERERERKLLQKIDEAIAKIENHRYGFCVSCGAEIGINRLEARPTSTQCIDCKELDEIRERHY